MIIKIERGNKIRIEFEDNTELEVIDQTELMNEVHLWFIDKDGNIHNLSQG